MHRSAAAVTTQTRCAHLRMTPGRRLRRMLDTARLQWARAHLLARCARLISHGLPCAAPPQPSPRKFSVRISAWRLANIQDKCSAPQTTVCPRAPAGTVRASYIPCPAMHRTAAAATSHVCSAHLRVTPGRHSRRMLYNAESSGPARSCWHAERVLHLTAYRAPLRRNRHRANSVCACMRDTWQAIKSNARHRRLLWACAHLLARCARLTSHTQPCAAPPQPSHCKHSVRISA